MIKTAMQYLLDLKQPNVIRYEGGTFVDKNMSQLKRPTFPTLHLNTLDGLVEYLKKIIDEREDDCSGVPSIVHIFDETEVLLQNVARASEGSRDCMVQVRTEERKFKFGVFYDAESFNVAMQSMFQDTEDKATILQVVGNLRDDTIRTMVDDGVSQVTSVRTGVATVCDVKIPNPVTLKPYRTFLEVEQPESKFIFRMREGGQCGIFEADGGAWKLAAKKNIYSYLKEQLKEELESGRVVLLL